MLKLILRRLPSAIVTVALLPIIAGRYFRGATGREYGVGLVTKVRLLVAMVRNNARIPSASNFISHLLMAGEIMNVPRSVEGVIVECGCYKGGSTVNLSLVAAACGRELHVFDSFAGLPAPSSDDSGHVVVADHEVYTYVAGDYAGTLPEVTANVERGGRREVCTFHEGYFELTLPGFDLPVVFAYLDVDLVSSEKTCLEHLWPQLVDGGYLYTDEAHHLEIATLFHDPHWWASTLGAAPPGLVGAGSGLGLFLHEGGFRSSIGYTVKVDRDELVTRPG